MFAIWQAYNRAIVINSQQDGEDPPKETYFTGFFFGYVVGMNLGIYWHHHVLNNIPFFEFFPSPILNGLLLGFIGGFTGHFIEKYNMRSKKEKGSESEKAD